MPTLKQYYGILKQHPWNSTVEGVTGERVKKKPTSNSERASLQQLSTGLGTERQRASKLEKSKSEAKQAMLFGNAVIASGSERCRARSNRTEASAVRANEKRSGKHRKRISTPAPRPKR